MKALGYAVAQCGLCQGARPRARYDCEKKNKKGTAALKDHEISSYFMNFSIFSLQSCKIFRLRRANITKKPIKISKGSLAPKQVSNVK